MGGGGSVRGGELGRDREPVGGEARDRGDPVVEGAANSTLHVQSFDVAEGVKTSVINGFRAWIVASAQDMSEVF